MNRVTIVVLSLVASGGLLVAGCQPTGTEEVPPGPAADANAEDPDTGQPDADVDADDANGDDPPAPPEIEISPDSHTFEGIDPEDGETGEFQIAVKNEGEADLQIEEIDWELEHSHAHELDIRLDEDDAEDPEELATTVPDYRIIDYHVEYTPLEYGSTRGEIVIHSDDPDRPEVPISIDTISAGPEIEAPDQITFGNLDPDEGETESQTLEGGEDEETDDLIIANRGLEDLFVEDVRIEGDDAEAFSVQVRDATGVADLPDTLERNIFWYLDLTFTAEHDDQYDAELVIESNDPVNSEHRADVRGNPREACLSTSGNLDFGQMSPGDSQTRSITVLNCSQHVTLTLEDIELVDDGGGVFELTESYDEPIDVGTTLSEQIEVEATLDSDREVLGRVTMSSNDPGAQHVTIDLRVLPAD